MESRNASSSKVSVMEPWSSKIPGTFPFASPCEVNAIVDVEGHLAPLVIVTNVPRKVSPARVCAEIPAETKTIKPAHKRSTPNAGVCARIS
jgi:hypothetical protein